MAISFFQKTAFALARTFFPVVHYKGVAYVFRDADVREIVGRDQDFTLRQVNQENIERHLGPFMLGMDDGPRYREEKGILQSVVRHEDIPRLKVLFREECQRLTQGFVEKGEFELVDGYIRKMCLIFFDRYLGVPGPSPEKMLHWNRSLFWDAFLNLNNDAKVRAVATESAGEMRAYFEELIPAQKALLERGEKLPDTWMTRLLELQNSGKPAFDDDGIRRNLSGNLLGMMENTAKACVNILKEWYKRPAVLAKVREAALKKEVDKVGKFAYEALRFDPNIPVLIRYAEKEQRVGPKDGKKRRIKANHKVFALIMSANYDTRRYAQPKRFDPSRSKDNLLVFGYGLHKCFGTYVNYVSIPEIMMALMALPSLEPVEKEPSQDGPFPGKWGFRV